MLETAGGRAATEVKGARWVNVLLSYVKRALDGRISDVLATMRFRSRDGLHTTIECYVKLYNDHLPQKALGHKTPL